MAEIDGILAHVETLIVKVKPAEAADHMRSLLASMGGSELRVWEPDIRLTINKFLPKKRRELTSLLEDIIASQEALERPDLHLVMNGSSDVSAAVAETVDFDEILEVLDRDLADLSQRHIFQWSTFYRDYLSNFFADCLEIGIASNSPLASAPVRERFEQHAHEIFTKGYYHVTRRESDQVAMSKSLAGLQRFLDLPIEFYAARVSGVLKSPEVIPVRELTSAMLCGILQGYAGVEFGPSRGADLLVDNARSWAHALGFMTEAHARAVVTALGPGTLSQGCVETVLPFARAIDRLVSDATNYFPLPALAQLVWSDRRLDVSLQPPSFSPDRRPVEIQCYLDPGNVTPELLTEAADRDIAVVIASLRSDLRAFVGENERLSQSVVPVMEDSSADSATARRAVSILEQVIYRRRSPRVGARPIDYNFAKEFPLNRPELTRFYHVYRTSVRSLLRTFERRNGVRLWCSVRRSGKTTAGFDLGSTTGNSVVITQTCDDTGRNPNDGIFYKRVCDAIQAETQLSRDFLEHTIAASAPGGQVAGHRTVLVLDEYETLFGQLSTAVDNNLRLRYTVAQPLLNQMVAFARENLIVFLGQQPTAHYVLMDQNQLSAYVEQDAFPLFALGEEKGAEEFSELLSKILSTRVSFDNSFVRRVFVETGGHPYLTVNMMVEFCEWLIRTKRRANSLSFTSSDISDFSTRMLRRDHISVTPEYRFFRDAAIRHALSNSGRLQNPWLYAVYKVLRTIALEKPDSFSCSRTEFADIVDQLALEESGITSEYLLATAAQANFLDFSGRYVRPKIRLLARIAAVATPEVRP